MEWADGVRRMKVRANAETPADARAARYFGAEGIGLCRTEHMFFEAERIVAMREMILAETTEAPPRGAGRDPADAAPGLHRAVRDHGGPAGHHPPARSAAARIPAASPSTRSTRSPANMGIAADYLRTRVAELQEFNPMLGHRGVRLAISYPEIAEMQARAIFEAAVEVATQVPARRRSRRS